MAEEQGAAVCASADASAQSWLSMFPCCTTSLNRKQGGLGDIFSSGSGTFKKRVLLLGSPECGKSRILHILSHPEEPLNASWIYIPTAGTNTVQVTIPPIGYTFTEVGGGLDDFWARSLDNKVDAIWYLMTRSDFIAGNYVSLLTFIESAKSAFIKKQYVLVVSVLDIGESVVSTSDLEIQLNALGIIDPKKLSVVTLPFPSSPKSILCNIEVLKSKLV